jgi:AcrR family transcriptional regulator
MSPKPVDKNQRKNEIALIALQFFAKGYKEASISDIAKGVGIGKGTIYEYFKTKEELFSLAISLWIEDGASLIRSAIKDITNPVDKLNAVLELCLTEYGPDNPEVTGVCMAIFQQTFNPNGVFYEKKEFIYSLSKGLVSIISEIIIEGAEKKFFTEDSKKNAPVIGRNILAYMDGISIHRMTAGKSFKLKQHTDLFFQTLINAITNKK